MDQTQAKALAGQYGIDWTNIDWTKVLQLLQFLIELLRDQPVYQGAASKDIEHCDHAECCHKTLEAALCTAHCAAKCCATCHTP